MPKPRTRKCMCRWLERCAEEPAIPIVFDQFMNEYHLLHEGGKGYSLLYYCPFCGKSAPKSLRGSYFAKVSDEESQRLYLLTEKITTEEEMRAAHGEPDHVLPISGSLTTPATKTKGAETVVGGRCLIYNNLSDTAEVRVNINRYGKLQFSFSGKYIGPKRDLVKNA